MAKIPFTLDAWLKDKNQIVETRDGRIVHNIWKVKEPFYTNNKKAEVCALIDGEEDAIVFYEGGRYLPTTKDTDNPFDLLLITPEPELTEFEKSIKDLCWKVGMGEVVYEDDIIKKTAAELLELARKEIDEEIPEMEFTPIEETLEYKAGFRAGKEETFKELSEKEESPTIIEARSFNAGRKQGKAEALKEFEEKYKQSWFNEGKIAGRYEGLSEDEKYQQGVHDGKEEALQDLPRWKVSRAMRSTMPTVMWGDNGMILYKDGFEISIPELENLPKED